MSTSRSAASAPSPTAAPATSTFSRRAFQILAGVVAPSHGFVHVVDYDCPVSVAGMVVESGDLLHADRHGAVVIPAGTARAVVDAAALIARREAVVIGAARGPGADAAAIKEAMRASAKVT